MFWIKCLIISLLTIPLSGCATDYFVKQNEAINQAEKEGKIDTYQALQLKNDLYKYAPK